MAATPEDVHRIAAFALARVDEQMSGDNAQRHWADDDVSRALRALSRTVGNLRAKTALADNPEPELKLTGQLAVSFAWQDLQTIADQWSDHPDYLPEFDLPEHRLNKTPAAPHAEPR
jgi:hypothetical protein